MVGLIRAPGSKALGYLCETGDGKIVRENDTGTCQHLGEVFKIDPGPKGKLTLNWCKKCMGLVCPKCATKPCIKFIDEQEKLQRKIESQSWL